MSWNFTLELMKWGPRSPSGCSLREAQDYCAWVTKTHYENFTVASWLLPRRLVPDFQSVYAYCRWSDDLADETPGADAALSLLDWWEREFFSIYQGTPRHPVMIALAETIWKYHIPREPFLKLLTAFRQDQSIREYETYDQLLGYCVNSANPVGHLVLYLFECFNPKRAIWSDDICTALQLTNFWQDIHRDLLKGRIYLPRVDRHSFGYPDEHLHAKRCTEAFRELLGFQVHRTRELFDRGRELLRDLPRAARLDISLFVLGGEAILKAIEQQNYDVFSRRPTLSKTRKAMLVFRALASSIR